MITWALCAAAAVLIAPGSTARRRLGTRSRIRLQNSLFTRVPLGYAVAAITVVAAWWYAGIGLAVAVACATATAHVRRRASRRTRDRDEQSATLAAGLDVVIADLRVGAHPVSACDAAAGEIDGPVGHAFARAAARGRLGGSSADAFTLPGTAVDADIARVSAVWAVAERHGLPLATLLDAARTDMLGRSRFRSRTGASLSGARATAMVLAALPAIGIALGQLMGASPLRVLAGGGLGGVLTAIGVGLVCAGLLWTDRITTIATS